MQHGCPITSHTWNQKTGWLVNFLGKLIFLGMKILIMTMNDAFVYCVQLPRFASENFGIFYILSFSSHLKKFPCRVVFSYRGISNNETIERWCSRLTSAADCRNKHTHRLYRSLQSLLQLYAICALSDECKSWTCIFNPLHWRALQRAPEMSKVELKEGKLNC